jgi:hypothetical protein
MLCIKGLFGANSLVASTPGFSIFHEAVSNVFLETDLPEKLQRGESIFLYYGGEAKKSGSFDFSDSSGEPVCKEALPNRL